ncbi:MAG: ABC transporter ATP-binding protein [Anaeromyxobacter sp.]
MTAAERHPLLHVSGLRKSFRQGGVIRGRTSLLAVDDVEFRVERGEAVALVGESGSGKSTIARLLVRLEQADAGAIRLDGRDVLREEPRAASLAYRSRVQMIFQDPFGSLNPSHSVAYHLERPLLRHGRATRADVREKTLALLRDVGLEPPEEFLERHPYELSGGQRQRVAIARALAVGPDLLVADEPTSMLDVSLRSGVLGLLQRLRRERGLGLVLITHDLAAARHVADRLLVLYRGQLVEDGPAAALIEAPAHPYTRALLAAVAHGRAGERPRLRHDPTPAAGGCPFAPRCPEVTDRCRAEPAPLVTLGAGRRARCHLVPATRA